MPSRQFNTPPTGLVDWTASPEAAAVQASMEKSLRGHIPQLLASHQMEFTLRELRDDLSMVLRGTEAISAAGLRATNATLVDFEALRTRVAAGDAEALGVLERGMDIVLQAAVGFLTGAQTTAEVEDLLTLAFGQDAGAALARTALIRPPGGIASPQLRPPSGVARPPLSPTARLATAQPRPPRGLGLDQVRQLEIWGTLRDMLDAFRRHGQSLGPQIDWAETVVATSKGIERMAPRRPCPGDKQSIFGKGFGTAPAKQAPKDRILRVPKAGGGCMSVPNEDILSWADTEIVIRLPPEVGTGCVGFLILPGPPPPASTPAVEVQQAAGMVQTVLGKYFGGLGVMAGQRIVDIASRLHDGVPFPCPPCLPAQADGIVPNHIHGGPPEITFTINGHDDTAVIHPDEAIVLAWSVAGGRGKSLLSSELVKIGSFATDINLPLEMLKNADPCFPFEEQAHALPPVKTTISDQASTLPPQTVPWDLADDWDVAYTIRAESPCPGQAAAVKTVRVQMREPGPVLFGICDMHTHLVSHWSFARVGYWGDNGAPPRNPADLGDPADSTGRDAVPAEGPMAVSLRSSDSPDGYPAMPGLEDLGVYFGAFQGMPAPVGGGWPDFSVWPRADYLGYQQVHVDWLKRAYLGGLRLTVCLANNSEFAASRFLETYEAFRSERSSLPKNAETREREISDRDAIERQVKAARSMVEWVRVNDGGWMEIAATPDDAERIVREGRLALVLGVEVGSLGGWRNEEALNEAAGHNDTQRDALLDELIAWLQGLNVHHVFPIHGINNAFGGTALWMRLYDAANRERFGGSFRVDAAPEGSGIEYRLEQDTFQGAEPMMDELAQILSYYGPRPLLDEVAAFGGPVAFGAALATALAGPAGLLATLPVSVSALAFLYLRLKTAYAVPPDPGTMEQWMSVRGGQVNTMGLTESGQVFIRKLMRAGMLIDIDHMGMHSADKTLGILREHRYPPVAGHAEFVDMKLGPAARGQRPASMERDEWVGANNEFDRTRNAGTYGTANPKRLVTERDMQPQRLKAIRALGGMVGTFLAHGAGLACRCAGGPNSWTGSWRISNDAVGSAKSFAQNFEYLGWHLRGRRAAFGSDVNGAAPLIMPRFGPDGARGAKSYTDSQARTKNNDDLRPGLAPKRSGQVFAQDASVSYGGPASAEYRLQRFMSEDAPQKDPPFDDDQRLFWQALCVRAAGVQPEKPVELSGVIAQQHVLVNMGKGLMATQRSELPLPVDWNASTVAAPLGGGSDLEVQLAAWLATHPSEVPKEGDSARVKALVPGLRRVWMHWTQANHPTAANHPYPRVALGPLGAALYDADGRMIKHRLGAISALAGAPPRDFDINVDGMAHYGMLPDFVQDLANVGVPAQGLATLYRGAHDYIRTWRLCRTRAASMP
jgi:hypothetical protein